MSTTWSSSGRLMRKMDMVTRYQMRVSVYTLCVLLARDGQGLISGRVGDRWLPRRQGICLRPAQWPDGGDRCESLAVPPA